MKRRLQVDHLVVAGIDRAGLQPERLRAMVAEELARAIVGPAPASMNGTLQAAPHDIRGLAREIARAVVAAGRGSRP